VISRFSENDSTTESSPQLEYDSTDSDPTIDNSGHARSDIHHVDACSQRVCFKITLAGCARSRWLVARDPAGWLREIPQSRLSEFCKAGARAWTSTRRLAMRRMPRHAVNMRQAFLLVVRRARSTTTLLQPACRGRRLGAHTLE